jgi:hypothetical protein
MKDLKTKINLSDREKLGQILQFLRLNIADFADETAISKDHLYNLSNGKICEFSRDAQIKILEKYKNISPLWLVAGSGAMVVSDSGNISAHDVGGDLLGNGATKTAESADVSQLIDVVSRLSAVVEQQTAQVSSLIEILKK